jgi:hypothetical protein
MGLKDKDLRTALGIEDDPADAKKKLPANASPAVPSRRLRDALVLRGYLEQAGQTPKGVTVWRLYLSARKDIYVDFVARDAIRVAPYTPTNPADPLEGAVTVWLTTVPPPRHYFISRPLQAPTGFVSGALLDDLMGSQDA